MHPRTTELLEQLDTHRAALRRAVEEIPEPQRERRPAPDRWSVAEVLEHLGLVEGSIARLLGGAIAGGLPPERETSPVVDRLAPARIADRRRRVSSFEPVVPSGALDCAAAWAALERSREELRAVVLAGDGLALGEIVHPHRILGPLDGYQWVLFVAGHEARHAAQIREIAAAPASGG
ncbi:MAG TPA: DinB family protein [Gemmatimonadaceae bacterium]|nr:DinB family protein [Gemmatimonadaceae bacterium]